MTALHVASFFVVFGVQFTDLYTAAAIQWDLGQTVCCVSVLTCLEPQLLTWTYQQPLAFHKLLYHC